MDIRWRARWVVKVCHALYDVYHEWYAVRHAWHKEVDCAKRGKTSGTLRYIPEGVEWTPVTYLEAF